MVTDNIIKMGGSSWNPSFILSFKSKDKFVESEVISHHFDGYSDESRRSMLGQVYDIAVSMKAKKKDKE